jgi:hypothetical protein
MCFASKPAAPPPPPPPAPPIQPIEIGANEEVAAERRRKRRLGPAQLQIPLSSTTTSGLGIPG